MHQAAAIEAGAGTTCHNRCCAHPALQLVPMLVCDALWVQVSTIVVEVRLARIRGRPPQHASAA